MSNGINSRILALLWSAVDWCRRLVNEVTNHPRVTTFGSLIIFLFSLNLISKELNQYALADLSQAFDAVRISTTLGAIIAVALTYSALSLNDRFCLSMIGKSLNIARTVRASIAAYALAKTLGYSWAIASTARARLYGKWGLTQGEIGALSMTTGTSVQIGGLCAASLGLVFGAYEITRHGHFNIGFWWIIALFLAVPAMIWVYYSKKPNTSFKWGATKVKIGNVKRTIAHLSLVMFDKMGAAMALFLLLPDHGGWTFPAFLAVFILAGLLGAISGAPGGLGVFEAAILTMAPTTQNIPGAAVALVVYRLIYNIFPLIAATIILGLDHAAPAAKPASRVAKKFGTKAVDLAPQILAILFFISGFALVGASAVPLYSARYLRIETIINPELLEVSHFAIAIIGMVLMMAANFVWREISNVYWFSLGLLFVAIVISFLKGIAWEMAIILSFVMVIGLSVFREFSNQNKGEITPISFRWVAAIIGSLAIIIWVSYFSYQSVAFSPDLFFETGVDANAARSLRAICGALAVLFLGIFAIWLFAKPKANED